MVTQSGGTVTDGLGSLAPGQSATLTLNVIPTASGTIQNTAIATTDSGVSNSAGLSATDTTTIGATPAAAADLQITKVDSAVGTPIVPGTTFAYIVTVTNHSTTNAANNVVIADALPAGLSYLGSTSFIKAPGPTGASAPRGTVTQTGGSISDAIGTLAPGASATLEIVVTATQADPLTNTATATTTSGTLNPSNLVATDSTIVGSVNASNEAALSITKTAAPGTGVVGGNEIYTITVTNNSATNEAANTNVADLLPAGTMYVSGSASQGAVSESNGIVSANLGTLAPGASATITLALMPTAAGSITNTAVVSTSSGNANPTTTASATTSVSAAGAGAADVSVTKTVSPTTDTAGLPVTYTLTVTNNGAVNSATDTIVTDALDPAGLAFISATSSVGTVSQAGGIVTAKLGTLAAGQSATITITALPTLIGPIANTAAVSTSAGNTSSNATATTMTTVNAADTSGADVSVTKTAAPMAGTVGQNETYTLVVTNNSTANAAANVMVDDAVPSGMSYVSATSTVGTINQSGGTVTGDLGTLAPGASATVVITLKPNAAGTVVNTAVVSTVSGDADLSNNTATATTVFAQPSAGVNLSITKTDSSNGAAVVPGQALSYTITITNSGTSDASNVTISDPLPAGLLFISDTSTSGTSGTGANAGAVSMSNGTLTDSIGTLAAGQSVTLVIRAMPLRAGTLANTATVATTSQNNK
ncbi:MAG TPA: DUF11 domain-containing protein [Pirellulales bacterium]|nr:DUF11 domain-containing protein [Pirellulales bacterium]